MNPMNHVLKSWPEFFQPVLDDVKKFDLRMNDRNFKVGDRILFREYEPDGKRYTGRECSRDVIYILDGIGQGCIEPYKGLLRGYCILGLREP